MTASSTFFTRDMEECFIRTLAVRLRLIPDNANVMTLDILTLAQIHAENPECNGFLNEAEGEDGYIRGTRVPFPHNDPHTKYETLFYRASFTAIRYAFLLEADPGLKVHSFLAVLQELMET